MTRDAISDVLERLVPPFDGDSDEWRDVLERAAAAQPFPHRRRRLALGVTAIVAAVVTGAAATPFGRAIVGDTLGRLGAWVDGSPGDPVSAEEQRAFERQNRASYASFPSGTELREIVRVSDAGRELAVQGFQSQNGLCLALVHGAGRRRMPPSCVPKAYVRQVDEGVVVAGEGYFRIGDPARSVEATYGFVADDVTAVEVERERSGRTRAVVADNVFLTHASWPAGTAARPGPADPLVRLWAVGADGRRRLVRVVSGGLAVREERDVPGPAYTAVDSRRADELPGPRADERPLTDARIGWLARGEQRGEPVELVQPPRRFGRTGPAFPTVPATGRAIQPDPGDPFRVAIWLERGSGVCLRELHPLTRGSLGFHCIQVGHDSVKHAGKRALALGGYAGGQWTRLTGLAVDGVARIDLYLSSGRHFPVPLRDNVFSVQAPFPELPGKLVAYDGEGRVVDLFVIPGPMKLRRCPRGLFGRPAAELPPPRPYERIDLGARTIAGEKIFGRTVDEVIAALGRPARIEGKPGWRQRSLRYGGATAFEAALEISFRERFGRVVAAGIHLRSPSVVDERLGHVLWMQPERLQRRIQRVYGDRYRLTVPYGSQPERNGCGGTFETKGPYRRTLQFGLNPRRPSSMSLTIWWG